MTQTTKYQPLLPPPTLPYSPPDYSQIRPEHYLPAFSAAFEVHLAEVGRITGSDEAPTFANTIEALERSGALLERVMRTFYTVSSADATEEIQAIETEL